MSKKDVTFKIILRIAALTGAVLLLGMYIATLVAALSSSPDFERYLMGSIGTTVFIPALIYGLQWLSKFLQGK